MVYRYKYLLQTMLFILLRWCGNSIFNSWETAVLFYVAAVPLSIHTNNVQGFQFLHIFTSVVIFAFLIVVSLLNVSWYLISVLITFPKYLVMLNIFFIYLFAFIISLCLWLICLEAYHFCSFLRSCFWFFFTVYCLLYRFFFLSSLLLLLSWPNVHLLLSKIKRHWYFHFYQELYWTVYSLTK